MKIKYFCCIIYIYAPFRNTNNNNADREANWADVKLRTDSWNNRSHVTFKVPEEETKDDSGRPENNHIDTKMPQISFSFVFDVFPVYITYTFKKILQVVHFINVYIGAVVT